MSSFRGGLLAGFIAGAFLSAGVVLLLRPRPEPSAPAPVSPPPSAAVLDAAAALKEENRVLKDLVADLKKGKAPVPSPPEAKTEPEKPAGPDLKDLFAKMAESGGRSGGVEVLAAMKAQGKAGVEFMANVLRTSKSALERLLAAAFLEQSGDSASIEPLALALKNDTDDMVRRMAARALGVLAQPAGESPLRAAIADDPDWGVRVNASYGLAKLGKEDGLRLLREFYESTETPAEYRLGILSGLADVAAPSTAPLFRKILADTKDSAYLLAAIGALGKMKDVESLPALEKIAGSTSQEMVKQAATKAIDTIRK
jgi:HEAT repeat protein